ncbi:LacI family DNA-binding transcriptional regulator [Antarcticirhabdus aurantiaca]|uniref:LacI family DNA-binding transcriptional regulator n=1 Tax=Antarcticirhabdus aurantiaca TaxID=2606717 RepID=A0ACD4NH20_9HYPH|nr:LacI family DNA-binding transcriptional regulator [Antarcticirhabdus aurantiaca]WAJ26101.1 LacI family DNA-binding transcriptional regulator [Jeongeuplla avenae]
MGRKPTMADVAREAAVSLATVDRVLNGRGGVDTDKEARVLTAARRLRLDRAIVVRPHRMLRVAVLIQAPSNPFHAALRIGLDTAARIHADLNIQFLLHHIDPNDPEGTAATLGRQAAATDGLIVTLPDEPRITEAVRVAALARPVVTLATDLPTSGRAAYVGPDDRRAGRVAGDLMGLFLEPEGGRVLLIAGRRDIVGQRSRQDGFREILAERHLGIEVAQVAESGEDGERAGRIVLEALSADPAIRGIYHMSAGAQPVAAALRRLGRTASTAFVTHELTPDRRALLRERAISAVIDQQPQLEARIAAETMAQLLGRLDGAAKSSETGFTIHMPENA